MHNKLFFRELLVTCLILHEVIAKKTVKIDDYAICGRDPSCPMHIYNMSLDYSGESGFFLNVVGELYRDLNSESLLIDIAITRCLSKENPDTCEKQSSLRSPGLCRLINLNGVGWDEIRDGFKPSLRCPQKKGIYVGKGLNLNPSAFKLFPIEGFYWKINGSLYEGRQYFASLCFAVTVVKIK